MTYTCIYPYYYVIELGFEEIHLFYCNLFIQALNGELFLDWLELLLNLPYFSVVYYSLIIFQHIPKIPGKMLSN